MQVLRIRIWNAQSTHTHLTYTSLPSTIVGQISNHIHFLTPGWHTLHNTNYQYWLDGSEPKGMALGDPTTRLSLNTCYIMHVKMQRLGGAASPGLSIWGTPWAKSHVTWQYWHQVWKRLLIDTHAALWCLTHSRLTCDMNIILTNQHPHAYTNSDMCYNCCNAIVPFSDSLEWIFMPTKSTGTYKKSINTAKLEHSFIIFNTQVSIHYSNERSQAFVSGEISSLRQLSLTMNASFSVSVWKSHIQENPKNQWLKKRFTLSSLGGLYITTITRSSNIDTYVLHKPQFFEAWKQCASCTLPTFFCHLHNDMYAFQPCPPLYSTFSFNTHS